MWLEMNKCLVNPDGQVIPCCYLANGLFRHLSIPDHDLGSGRGWSENKTLKKYIDNKENFNLDNQQIDSILKSDWFNKDLPESWDSYDTIPHPCKIFCDNSYADISKDNET